jgi:hypothetical protein
LTPEQIATHVETLELLARLVCGLRPPRAVLRSFIVMSAQPG